MAMSRVLATAIVVPPVSAGTSPPSRHSVHCTRWLVNIHTRKRFCVKWVKQQQQQP